jgi:arylsulfatase A-like enzyme
VVLVIVDDVGVDALASFADVSPPTSTARPYPATPTVDSLCDEGVRFDNVWATPTCSPTRGGILTGNHGFRTGLDGVGNAFEIEPDTLTLPSVLSAVPGLQSANIGKWHLGDSVALGETLAPNTLGWDHFAGSLSNLDDYAAWSRVVDGTEATSTTYATTANVDDALAWWNGQPDDAPLLLWLAFNAPHVPFHAPPDALHSQAVLDGPAARYDAALEAMDTELSRLLSGVDDATHVYFLGDNGTPGRALRGDYDTSHAKGSLYQGGIHVPLCASGPEVTPGRHTGLVHTVDLFRTVTDQFGVEVPVQAGIDSRSLVDVLDDPSGTGLRDRLYAEHNVVQAASTLRGGVTVRTAQHKWIRFDDGSEQLFDLSVDPQEAVDLLGDPALDTIRDDLEAFANTTRSL